MNFKAFFTRIQMFMPAFYGVLAASLMLTAFAMGIRELANFEKLPERPFDSLTVIIAILVGSILGSAALATLVQYLFSNAGGRGVRAVGRDLGPIFERHVKWFSYVIGPVIASYGVVRIIEALR